MKLFITLILGMISLSGFTQELDTICANENHNTALFFPGKIRQAVVGASNFIFSYNDVDPQYFGLLKAVPGPSSNLLVLTREGEIYSYIISHKKDLPRLNHFITRADRLGHEVPKKSIGRPVLPGQQKEQGSASGSMARLETLAAHYLNTSRSKVARTRKQGLMLQVSEMIYFQDHVFLLFKLENHSGINFQPEYLRVYTVRGSRKRNASFQKLLKEPVLRYRLPENVEHGHRKEFALIFPKFTLGSQEKMVVELRERSGNRLLYLRFKRNKVLRRSRSGN